MTSVEPPAQPEGGRMVIADWFLSALRQLTVQNILTAALIIVVAVPSYFAWLFLTNASFRHEFMTTARIIDMAVPCEVVLGNISGKGDRHTVTASYAIRDRLEYLIAVRSTGLMSDKEVDAACRKAHDEVALMLRAMQQQSTPEAP